MTLGINFQHLSQSEIEISNRKIGKSLSQIFFLCWNKKRVKNAINICCNVISFPMFWNERICYIFSLLLFFKNEWILYYCITIYKYYRLSTYLPINNSNNCSSCHSFKIDITFSIILQVYYLPIGTERSPTNDNTVMQEKARIENLPISPI